MYAIIHTFTDVDGDENEHEGREIIGYLPTKTKAEEYCALWDRNLFWRGGYQYGSFGRLTFEDTTEHMLDMYSDPLEDTWRMKNLVTKKEYILKLEVANRKEIKKETFIFPTYEQAREKMEELEKGFYKEYGIAFYVEHGTKSHPFSIASEWDEKIEIEVYMEIR
jgi:hypothetical protein